MLIFRCIYLNKDTEYSLNALEYEESINSFENFSELPIVEQIVCKDEKTKQKNEKQKENLKKTICMFSAFVAPLYSINVKVVIFFFFFGLCVQVKLYSIHFAQNFKWLQLQIACACKQGCFIVNIVNG